MLKSAAFYMCFSILVSFAITTAAQTTNKPDAMCAALAAPNVSVAVKQAIKERCNPLADSVLTSPSKEPPSQSLNKRLFIPSFESDPFGCGFVSQTVWVELGWYSTFEPGSAHESPYVVVHILANDCNWKTVVDDWGSTDEDQQLPSTAFVADLETLHSSVDTYIWIGDNYRHLTVELTGTGQGFINQYKSRSTSITETERTSRRESSQWRDMDLSGTITIDSNSYVPSSGTFYDSESYSVSK